jgi:hypothetical protein
VRKDQFKFNTFLNWANYKTRIESISPSTSPTILGSTTPDWTGSVLNQFQFRNFFTTFLIDIIRGGDVVRLRSDTSVPRPNYDYIIEDGSKTILRDISLGYTWRFDSAHQLQCSLSGRNLWTIYSASEAGSEINAVSMQPSGTLSVSLIF